MGVCVGRGGGVSGEEKEGEKKMVRKGERREREGVGVRESERKKRGGKRQDWCFCLQRHWIHFRALKAYYSLPLCARLLSLL